MMLRTMNTVSVNARQTNKMIITSQESAELCPKPQLFIVLTCVNRKQQISLYRFRLYMQWCTVPSHNSMEPNNNTVPEVHCLKRIWDIWTYPTIKTQNWDHVQTFTSFSAKSSRKSFFSFSEPLKPVRLLEQRTVFKRLSSPWTYHRMLCRQISTARHPYSLLFHTI